MSWNVHNASPFKIFTPLRDLLDPEIDESVKKWTGRVIGSTKEILEALKILGREPKDYRELEEIIFEERSKRLNKALEDSCSSFW